MCTDIDYLPHLMMISEKDFTYDRRSSWTPSIASSSSSSTTAAAAATTTTTTTFEKKLFSYFKRFFRRSSSPSKSDSAPSSRRPSSITDEVIILPVDEQIKQVDEDKLSCSSNSVSEEEQQQSIRNSPAATTPTPDLLYDYDSLLARCLARQEHDRIELISQCQIPVTIPHADLIVGHSRSILVNWKSYTRLFRALNRDFQLFQQYINQSYGCQSSINQREQLTFNVRTTRSTFDKLLKSFLDEYVTCLACQKARTHLIKTIGLWRIECQLCGSQRSVKRLRWKR